MKSIEETDNWVEGVDFKFGKHGPEALKKGMTARPDFHSKRGFSIVPIEQAMRDTAKYLFDVNMAQLEEALDFAVKQASPEDARSALNEIKVRSLKDVARGFCLILTYGDELLGERNEAHIKLLLSKSPKFDIVSAAARSHRHQTVRELASSSMLPIQVFCTEGIDKIAQMNLSEWEQNHREFCNRLRPSSQRT